MYQTDNWKRTRYCGEICETDIDKTVVVNGWVQRTRDLGGLVFVQVRDRTGLVQAVFDESAGAGAFKAAAGLRGEYVVGVRGKVRMRSPDAVNRDLPTGRFEIAAEELIIFNKAETPPIYIEENLNVNEATRFKYRYLDLRRPDMQRGIVLRHKASKITRDFFDERGFL
jgi:aspartyl-tRNA synthetase